MMRTLIPLFCLCFLLSVDANAQQLRNASDSLSYSLGVLIGKNLLQGGYTNINPEIFNAAIQAAMNDQPLLLSPEACEQYMAEGAKQTSMKQHEENRLAGEKFLAENKKRDGVVSLDNGLQYEVIKQGDGVKPKATDEVIVHYHGTLPDGTIFDSSVDRGETISFPLNRVIKGWTEILQLMPVGSKWKVYIPYDLAYGDRSAGPHIKPYSALIFEIELFGIK